MSRAKAIAIINETMTACLPKGAPLSFSEIVFASFQGKNRIVAHVIMFDGLPAVLHLNRWAYGWSHGWDSMSGGDCYLDDGTWKRVSAQPDMFESEAA